MEKKILEEFIQIYKEWNRNWKHNQSQRHEEWEQRRSYADRINTFEENLRRRVEWERRKKHREWTQYRLKVEKKLLETMTEEEKDSLYAYVNRRKQKRRLN
jgi:hypothetical protein